MGDRIPRGPTMGNMEQSQRALCEASRSCARWASGGENRRHSLRYRLPSAQGNQAFVWQSVDVLCNPYDCGIVLHRRLWSTRASSIAIQADFRFNLEDTVDGVVAQFTWVCPTGICTRAFGCGDGQTDHDSGTAASVFEPPDLQRAGSCWLAERGKPRTGKWWGIQNDDSEGVPPKPFAAL